MNYTGFVYIWTNKINDKKYIGSHIGTENDGYIGSGIAFNKAIKKYGIINFERTILEFVDDNNSIREKEQYYLDLYDAANNKMFYNIKEKAGGGFEYINNHPILKNITKGIPKKNKQNYKRPKSEITRKKMSESALKREKVTCDICNKIVTKENLLNHKKAHTGEIVHSIEKRAKISQSVKNIPRIPCSLCSITINPSNMWRHMKKHERLKNDLQCI
jgi:group I intron endonuclease